MNQLDLDKYVAELVAADIERCLTLVAKSMKPVPKTLEQVIREICCVGTFRKKHES